MNAPSTPRSLEELTALIASGDYTEEDFKEFNTLAQNNRKSREDRNKKVGEIRKLVEELNNNPAMAIKPNEIITLFSREILSEVANTLGLVRTASPASGAKQKSSKVESPAYSIVPIKYKDGNGKTVETNFEWKFNKKYPGRGDVGEQFKAFKATGYEAFIKGLTSEGKAWMEEERTISRGRGVGSKVRDNEIYVMTKLFQLDPKKVAKTDTKHATKAETAKSA